MRRSKLSILKEISPEYSLEGLMLKLKWQYLGHVMWRTNSLEKILMLAKTEGRRTRNDKGWDGWMASLTQWTWVWVNYRSWWWTRKLCALQWMGSQRIGHDWGTELNSTEVSFDCFPLFLYFLLLWLNLLTNVFHRQKAGRGHGESARTVMSCSISLRAYNQRKASHFKIRFSSKRVDRYGL